LWLRAVDKDVVTRTQSIVRTAPLLRATRECAKEDTMKTTLAVPVILMAMVFAFGTVWAAPQNPPSAPVTVVNTPANPVPVNITNLESPATPFQARLCSKTGSLYSCGDAPDSVTVPAGKTLVVEFINGLCEVFGKGTTLECVTLQTIANSTGASHYLTVTPVSPPVELRNHYTLTQQSRIYADPDTPVRVGMNDWGPDDLRCFVTISGQLVTAP